MPVVIGITDYVSKQHGEWDLPEKKSELYNCMWGVRADSSPHLFKIEHNNQEKLM